MLVKLHDGAVVTTSQPGARSVSNGKVTTVPSCNFTDCILLLSIVLRLIW